MAKNKINKKIITSLITIVILLLLSNAFSFYKYNESEEKKEAILEYFKLLNNFAEENQNLSGDINDLFIDYETCMNYKNSHSNLIAAMNENSKKELKILTKLNGDKLCSEKIVLFENSLPDVEKNRNIVLEKMETLCLKSHDDENHYFDEVPNNVFNQLSDALVKNSEIEAQSNNYFDEAFEICSQ